MPSHHPVQGRSEKPPVSTWKASAALFFACLLVYLSNGRAHPEVDCVAAPYTAWSLIRHASLDLRYYPELSGYVGVHIREVPSGQWISLRPPGSALAAVPIIAPLALACEAPSKGNAMNQLGKLAAALCVAAGVVFFFALCRSLAPAGAWPATVLFAFGTCLYSVASQALWTHGPATGWLCAALYFLCRSDKRGRAACLAAGLSLGMAVLTRSTTAFFVLASVAALLYERRWRDLAWMSAGGAAPACVLILLNWTTFRHPFLGGYAADNWTESPPFLLGLGGLLIAPSRGVLVYSPALLLVPWGVACLVRRGSTSQPGCRGILVAWLIGAAATLCFHARWHDWQGGWCYGPRFLCETMPILCVLFGVAYSALHQPWMRGVAVSLVVLSVAVHAIGVFGYGGYEAWQQRHDLHDQGRSLFALRDTQIEAHARALLGKFTSIRAAARR